MSYPIFPSLPGRSWPIVKTPIWSTEVQKSANGREIRAALYATPIWKYRLSFEVLREDDTHELAQLMGLFNTCRGRFGRFLFLDPTDNSVVDQMFGVGNGIQTRFPLTRSIGAFTEPIAEVVGSPTFKAGGIAITGVVANGMVTFASPPSGELTWTGQFYYRCRFEEDSIEFSSFLEDLWETEVEFRSTR